MLACRTAGEARKTGVIVLGGGSLVARGETEWVCVDIRSGRPRKIPGEVVEMINHVLSDEGESR